MSVWRFPEALGGREWADSANHGDEVGFDLPGMERLWLPAAYLTEVTPPLPEEPAVGSFAVVTGGDFGLTVFHRHDQRGFDWFDIGAKAWDTWSVMHARGKVQVLVPAPEPVALPWAGEESDGGRITVDRYDAGNVSVVLAGRATAWFPLATAREFGQAVIAAADQAEAAAS